MTISNLPPDPGTWPQLYSSSESRWKDLERMGVFLIPIISLVFFAVMYVIIGYALFHIESWAPERITWLSSAFYFLWLILVLFTPLIAAALGLLFIFKQAVGFMRSLYQPAEAE